MAKHENDRTVNRVGTKTEWSVLSWVYLIVREGDGRVKHSPYDALIARWCSERSFVSEEVIHILWEHGADIDGGKVHGLTCKRKQSR